MDISIGDITWSVGLNCIAYVTQIRPEITQSLSGEMRPSMWHILVNDPKPGEPTFWHIVRGASKDALETRSKTGHSTNHSARQALRCCQRLLKFFLVKMASKNVWLSLSQHPRLAAVNVELDHWKLFQYIWHITSLAELLPFDLCLDSCVDNEFRRRLPKGPVLCLS